MTCLNIHHKLPGVHPQQNTSKEPIQEAHDDLQWAERHPPVVGLPVLVWLPRSIASSRAWLLAPVFPCA